MSPTFLFSTLDATVVPKREKEYKLIKAVSWTELTNSFYRLSFKRIYDIFSEKKIVSRNDVSLLFFRKLFMHKNKASQLRLKSEINFGFFATWLYISMRYEYLFKYLILSKHYIILNVALLIILRCINRFDVIKL